jgi:Zinc finger C-x8-C-x5-C-x3-H type (and similar)
MADRQQHPPTQQRLPSGFYNPPAPTQQQPVPGNGSSGLLEHHRQHQQQQAVRYDYNNATRNNNNNNNNNNSNNAYPFPAAPGRSQQQQISHHYAQTAPPNRNRIDHRRQQKPHTHRPPNQSNRRHHQPQQHHHNQQQHQQQHQLQQQQQQQQHTRKRPPQESSSQSSTLQSQSKAAESSFRCDACNLSLDSSAALQAHMKSHVTCHHPGCNFSAASKIVKSHYQSVHGKFSNSSGSAGFKTITLAIPGVPVQRFRICVGNRPQDVQEWIAERRQRFPRQMTQSRSNSATVKYSIVASSENKQQQQPETASHSSPLAVAAELSTLLQGYGSSSEEEQEDEEKNDKNVNVSKASDENTAPKQDDDVSSRMGTGPQAVEETDPSTLLVGRADGAQHKEEDLGKAVGTFAAAAAATTTTTTTTATATRNKKPCHAFMRHGKCHRGDACPYRHDNLSSPHAAAATATSNQSNNTGQTLRSNKRPKLTLLEKLLTNDVARETALTLQLLEYIAKSNFLQRPATPPPPPSGGGGCEDEKK